MKLAKNPPDEALRLQSLKSYGLLDTPPEEAYDALAQLACFISTQPISLISLMDEKRQWHKAKIGVHESEMPRHLSFCNYAVSRKEVVIVTDATKDKRFANHPAVKAKNGIRSYVGIPLINPEGFVIGTLCVAGPEVKKLSSVQLTHLKALAKQVVVCCEQRRAVDIIRIHQEQIVKLAKMSSLGEMAAGIAHEINNPLMVISGKAFQSKRLLKKSQYKIPELEEYLLKIEDTTRRIGKIVNGLKTFSQNSEGAPFEKVSLSNLMSDTLSLCEEKFRYHNVAFKLKKPKEDFILECLSVQISQVIINLLNNAFDAIKGYEEKWIKVEIKEKNGSLEFKVKDCGTGITPKIATKIMQPFFTTKEFGKGTGLGLSISKGIIEAHQGSFYYEPKEKNTTFVFSLPLTQAKA